MELDRHLARTMLSLHPVESARILETLPPAQATEILTEIKSEEASRVIERMTPQTAARVVDLLQPDQLSPIFLTLPLRSIAAILRPLEGDRKQAIVQSLPSERAQEIRPLLDLADGTAGGLMDPDILVLPRDITVSEAMARLRQRPEAARENLYLVDENRVLAGYVALSALMTAARDTPLLSLRNETEQTLGASAGIRSILSHPGWKLFTSIPVVDNDGVLLGALDHRTLRYLEGELEDGSVGTGETTEALGDLFRAALVGVLDSLVTPSRPGKTSVSGVDR